VVTAVVWGASATLVGWNQSPSTTVTEMRNHFADALLAVDAVERGDLASATSTIGSIARMNAPVGVTEQSAPYLAAFRTEALQASRAKSLDAAATGVGKMLVACGDCHRASTVRPGPEVPRRPDIGGLIGHMLDHQRAIDKLTQSLVMSSDALWNEGLDGLAAAPLTDSELASQPSLAKGMRSVDERVHTIASGMRSADTPEVRAASYASILVTCAQCHSQHSHTWGPSGTR
jgi:cytochrome c553